MSRTDGIKLWVAQGFGTGRFPRAPGTVGSLPGLVLFALLLLTGNFWFYLICCLAGVGASVWLCGEAERILEKSDPGSVVLDEIIALPICFCGWVGTEFFCNGAMPGPEIFFSDHLIGVMGVFIVFRVFDIAKPWPVGWSQKLPGGWGVTVDDVLAAVYVNLVAGVCLVVF